jgi:hypothetical protein
MKRLFLCSALIIIASSAEAAAPLLDQAFERYGGFGGGLGQGQTFVVGMTGRLVRVEVPLLPEPDLDALTTLKLSIVRPHNHIPRAFPEDILTSALATFPTPELELLPDPYSFPGWPLFQWVPFELSPINVAVGDELALVLSSLQSEMIDHKWAAAFPGAYPFGKGYQGFSTDVERTIDMGGDFLFRTYVLPIPEPATASMLIISLACCRVIARSFRTY